MANSGQYTDETLATRRRLAEAMLKQGMEATPISSHWQGAARLANALIGGMGISDVAKEQKAAEAQTGQMLANLPGLGGSPASSMPAPAAPSAPRQATGWATTMTPTGGSTQPVGTPPPAVQAPPAPAGGGMPAAPTGPAGMPVVTKQDGLQGAEQIRALLANPRTRSYGMQLYQEQRKLMQPQTTDEMKEYALDAQQLKAAGKTVPNFGEWKAALKRAGATKVSVSQGYENEFSKTVGKKEAENYDKLVDAGRQARQQVDNLDAIGNALNVYNSGSKFGTGALGPAEQTLRQYGMALGIGNAQTVAGAELAQSIQNRMALMMRSPDGGMGMPGALSDSDRKFLVASQPGIDKSPAGNAKMIDTMKKLEQRKIEIGDMAAQWVQQHKSMKGFESALSKWAKENPLFPPTDTSTGSGGWNIKRVQ